MGEVDVKTSVMAYSVGAMRVVFRFRSTRWVPEVAPMRFEDAGTGAYLVLSAIVQEQLLRKKLTYDVCASELLFSDIEHVGELVPYDHVSLDKDCTRLRSVFIDELLRLRT
jgi:hypothetical protein